MGGIKRVACCNTHGVPTVVALWLRLPVTNTADNLSRDMSNQITDAEWLLPAFILFVKALSIIFAVWLVRRMARRGRSDEPARRQRVSGTPSSLFPPVGAIVEERRRRGD